MNIYFKPTWLYIKQHNKTGLKYFGKTIHDPMTYSGSGKHWKWHLRKHGDDVTTTWCQLFTDRELLTEYALQFSEDNNIVGSDEWANLKPETGIDGGIYGPVTDETKRKISQFNKGKTISAEQRQKISTARKGIVFSAEHRKNLSKAKQGQKYGPPSEEHRKNLSKAKKGTKLGPQTEERKRTQSVAQIGSRWWNNGIVRKFSKECPGPDFILGFKLTPQK